MIFLDRCKILKAFICVHSWSRFLIYYYCPLCTFSLRRKLKSNHLCSALLRSVITLRLIFDSNKNAIFFRSNFRLQFKISSVWTFRQSLVKLMQCCPNLFKKAFQFLYLDKESIKFVSPVSIEFPLWNLAYWLFYYNCLYPSGHHFQNHPLVHSISLSFFCVFYSLI